MPSVSKRPPLRFGAFEVHVEAGELRKQGVPIKLHDKPFQILLALLENPGEVVTRKELQERLWPKDTFVEFENGLNNAISRLRSVLGDSPESPRFIETVPRHGYRFMAPVSPTAAASARVPLLSRRPVQVALVVVALATVALVNSSLTERPPRISSLAVLPFSFVGPSSAGDQDYLSSAMTDAVLQSLSKISSLRLAPREVSDAYRGSSKPLTEIAHDLHVDAIVRGSVQPENNELQVNVQLVRATDGASLWTGSFHEPPDFLALTRDVTRGVVEAAKLDLTPPEEEKLAAKESLNPQAYADYLKGRYYMSQSTQASQAQALSYFEQAVAASPSFALGYQGLASYYEITDTLAPSAALPKAKSYALQALKFDGMLPAAHVALALAYFYGDWNWAASDREFTRGLELNPGLPSSRDGFAIMLSCMGRTQDALNQVQQTHSLDPLYFPAYNVGALVWLNAHQYDQSAQEASQLLSLHPNSASGHEDLGTAYIFEGKYPEAVQQFQEELADGGDGALVPALLGVAYARWGKRARAEQQLSELKRASAQGYVPPFWFAMVYASLSANEKAFDSLDRAFRERDSYMVFLEVTPFLDSLRSAPRFQKLVAKMKFPS